MTEEDPIPIPTPAFEGDFVLDETLSLESGEILVNPTLHYAVYGQLNAARDNAVLVCHALSGSALVGAWWPQLFLPGDLGLLEGGADLAGGLLLAQMEDLEVDRAGSCEDQGADTTEDHDGDDNGLASGGAGGPDERVVALGAEEGRIIGQSDELAAGGDGATGEVLAFASAHV